MTRHADETTRRAGGAVVLAGLRLADEAGILLDALGFPTIDADDDIRSEIDRNGRVGGVDRSQPSDIDVAAAVFRRHEADDLQIPVHACGQALLVRVGAGDQRDECRGTRPRADHGESPSTAQILSKVTNDLPAVSARRLGERPVTSDDNARLGDINLAVGHLYPRHQHGDSPLISGIDSSFQFEGRTPTGGATCEIPDLRSLALGEMRLTVSAALVLCSHLLRAGE